MDKSAFRVKILSWYQRHKRDLPWRRTTDPYKILVSEIMLQQTQVDRVIPKYALLIEKFPTVQDLAKASTGTVLELWSGLGYNSRAIRLQEAARIICEMFNGEVPCNREQLLSLPGIGLYTTNAILSFAFNLPCPCIDTNIRRILLHELKLPESTPKNVLYNIAKTLIPEGRSRDWHNALMDYGSSVLTAKKTGIKSLTTQSKFLHSRRWYRGQVMRLLIREKQTTIEELCKRFAQDKQWITALIREMQHENLLRSNDDLVLLPN